jgi:hypothetical protein
MDANKRGYMGGICVNQRLSAVQMGRYIHRMLLCNNSNVIKLRL